MTTYHCIIQFDGKEHEWSTYCSSPVSALDEFHHRAQLRQEVGFSCADIVRRKLKPDDYKIERLWNEAHEYDLPPTANPVITAASSAIVEPDSTQSFL